MLNTFYGIKLGQSQTYTASGVRIPVTEVLVEPLTVIQIKSADHDGYVALKVAFGSRNEKNISKPVLGELSRIKKYGVGSKNKKQGNEEAQKSIEDAKKVDVIANEVKQSSK